VTPDSSPVARWANERATSPAPDVVSKRYPISLTSLSHLVARYVALEYDVLIIASISSYVPVLVINYSLDTFMMAKGTLLYNFVSADY